MAWSWQKAGQPDHILAHGASKHVWFSGISRIIHSPSTNTDTARGWGKKRQGISPWGSWACCFHRPRFPHSQSKERPRRRFPYWLSAIYCLFDPPLPPSPTRLVTHWQPAQRPPEWGPTAPAFAESPGCTIVKVLLLGVLLCHTRQYALGF